MKKRGGIAGETPYVLYCSNNTHVHYITLNNTHTYYIILNHTDTYTIYNNQIYFRCIQITYTQLCICNKPTKNIKKEIMYCQMAGYGIQIDMYC